MRRCREYDRPIRGPRCFAESNMPVGFTIYESQVDKKVPKKLRHRMNPVPFDLKSALKIKVNFCFSIFQIVFNCQFIIIYIYSFLCGIHIYSSIMAYNNAYFIIMIINEVFSNMQTIFQGYYNMDYRLFLTKAIGIHADAGTQSLIGLYPLKFPPKSDGLLQIRFIFEQFHLFRHFDCKIHITVCSRSDDPVGSHHIFFTGER